jgi:biopolymer transport protein ExbD
MAPMIDVVFQLVAFFILALSVEPTRFNPDVTPPLWAAAGREPAPNELVLEIDKQGRIVTDAGPVGPENPNFGQTLDRLLAPVGDRTLVVLRADEATRYAAIAQLLDLVRAKGVAQVGLRLRRPQP